YANGQPWLVDSGFHSYQPSAPENQYLISRESHNLATVTGLDHTPDAPVRLVNKRVTKNIHDFTLKDHGYRKADVTRRVIYFTQPDLWIISDEVQSQEKTLQIAQNWVIEPKTNIRYLDNG